MHSPFRFTLRRWVADLLDISADTLDDDLRFRELGLSSLQVVQLLARVSEHLGRTVAATLAWEHPTIAALSAHLDGLGNAGRSARTSRGAVNRSSRAHEEPIAIVGMGCRYPGGIHDPASLWAALTAGVDGVVEVPEERWKLSHWFDRDPLAPGKMSTRWGGFIDDVAGFDAAFFRISPKEAAQMDPQQRLSLEVTWEALEDAGIVPSSLAGSRTAVFMGAWSQDYADLGAPDSQTIEQHSATGWNNSIIPARIAYALGLRGPVLTVNTACSSSLVAVHLAAQSLRSGECGLALVGGVNLLLSPHTTVQMTKFGGMSPSGRCRTFDAAADGYVRGEGCGTVVLRRLSDAIAAGDRIYAVIRGSAVNNDGASNGLTAPNPDAQREVLADAWRNAQVAPERVGYVEAHGTGTPLGDPIEASALGDVLGQERDRPLLIGSIKSNIGHLEGAAGIAGLMKTALSLHHGTLPGNLHFEQPNPLIDCERLGLTVVNKTQGFPGEGERFAGVSSFGYGGTNGHVALGELPYPRQTLLPLSADSEDELRALGERTAHDIAQLLGDRALRAVSTRAGHAPLRAIVRGRTRETLAQGLAQLSRGELRPERSDRAPRVVFVFSGHGSQWLGMGRDLLATEPTFARVLRECDRHIQEEAGWSVISALCADAMTSMLDQTDVLQPALYAIQVALARMLMSWGITPSAVMGQSIGEVAAAVVAGALDERAGARLIVRWSAHVAHTASGKGAMFVAALDREHAERWLTQAEGRGIDTSRVAISAELAPESISIAGELRAVEEVASALTREGVQVQRVAIDYACHSGEMAPVAAGLREVVSFVAPAPLAIPMWSTVRSRFVEGHELSAGYWAENLTRPIALRAAVTALATDTTHFLDIGPHPITLRSIHATLATLPVSHVAAFATCFRSEPAWRALEDVVATLWCAGVALDWAGFYGAGRRESAPLVKALPLLISGYDETALRAQAGRWAAWLDAHGEAAHDDVVRTAALHRAHLGARAAVLPADRKELLEALRALEDGRPHTRLVPGTRRELGKTVFVFPGQGSQWHAMGRELLEQSPVFAETVSACDAALRPHTGWSVREVLRGEGPDLPSLERIDVVQPALFAMNIALSALWRSLGVEPAAVVGHSQGEIAAAVVCGALSLEDGARVMALRSQLLERVAGTGAMATIELPVERVEQRLTAGRWSDLHVAVVNTKTSTVVAGASEQVESWIEAAQQEGLFCRRVAVSYASHTPHVEPILGALRSALASIAPRASGVPMVSSVTGAPISGERLDADYWCRNLREPVRLDRALEHLLSTGHGVWIEASAHPVLSMALGDVAQPEGVAVGSLRRDQGGLEVVLANLTELHTHGYCVDWTRLVEPGSTVALPPYAFRHQRYWLPRPPARGDVKTAGLASVQHPWLRSATSVADSGRTLLTGRIDLTDQPWLRDHGVFGAIVVPGTALLELAMSAAHAVDSPGVAELTLASPLVLSSQNEGVRLQIHVEDPDSQGQRPFSLFSRCDSSPEDQAWTRHASGVLLDTELPRPSFHLAHSWPPQGAETIDLSDAYERLAQLGYHYGDAFRGLRGVWRRDAEIIAQVELAPELTSGAAAYSAHPALLDASLHAVLTALEMQEGQPIWLPFSWSGVTPHLTGATELRVHFTVSADEAERKTVSVAAFDRKGRLVLHAAALELRRASAEQVRAAARDDSQALHEIEWQAIALKDIADARCHVIGPAGGLAEILGGKRHASVTDLLRNLDVEIPSVVLIDATSSSADARGNSLPERVLDFTAERLSELQTLLAEPRLSAASLLWATHHAIDAGAGQHVPLDLVAAPLWGLIRSARSENSERTLRLIDLDQRLPSKRALARLVATTSEPELAYRMGQGLAPRLAPARVEPTGLSPALTGTVLITGGLGELGQALALHLVQSHGVKHLVLTSRRGLESPGARALTALLEQAGAETVRVLACDVARRAEVACVLASIARERPLCAVFHLAGVLADGLALRLTHEQLAEVLAPKIDGALHLHELTRAEPLAAFVLFSSIAGVIGLQGQANYAASNVFLDALGAERRRLGLPAQSLAWGLWEQQGIGMSSHLGEAEVARMARQGVAPLSVKRGFALLDQALRHPASTLVAAQLDLLALSRALTSADGAVPTMFRALLRLPPRRASFASPAASDEALRARLTALPEREREGAVLQMVREEISSILGLPVLDVSSRSALKHLGLDSLMAVDLRNRLARRFDLTLPTTLAFDYPSAGAIAELLWEKLDLEVEESWDDDTVREKLDRISIHALRSSGVLELIMAQPDDEFPARPRLSVVSASHATEDVDGMAHDVLIAKMEEMLGVKHGG